MSKQAEAGLILKLYELRREETMRRARDWYFREVGIYLTQVTPTCSMSGCGEISAESERVRSMV